MKKEKEKRKADYRHYIAIAITVIFALLAIFVFNYALGRTIEGARDLGLSVAFYFCEMFGRENAVVVTVTELPKIPFFARLPLISAPTAPLPEAWADFQANWGRYWQLWATKENFLGYLSFLGQFVYQLCRGSSCSSPFSSSCFFCSIAFCSGRTTITIKTAVRCGYGRRSLRVHIAP